MINEQNAKLPQPPSPEPIDQPKPVNGPQSVASFDQSNEEIVPYPLAAPATAQIWPRVFPGL